MAKYPRSSICLTSLLEGSECQGATTVWTNPGFLLCIKIRPTRIKVAWQDVAIYLGIFVDFGSALERGGRHPSSTVARVLLIYCMSCSHYLFSCIGIYTE